MKIEISSKKCPECGKVHSFEVEEADWIKWQEGALIQRAFPYLNDNQRESLITGYCSECWDKLFKDTGLENEPDDGSPL